MNISDENNKRMKDVDEEEKRMEDMDEEEKRIENMDEEDKRMEVIDENYKMMDDMDEEEAAEKRKRVVLKMQEMAAAQNTLLSQEEIEKPPKPEGKKVEELIELKRMPRFEEMTMESLDKTVLRPGWLNFRRYRGLQHILESYR